MAAHGVPPHWSSYVNHSDVDGVVARATAAGGTVMFPPMDVMDSGRMTMIQDPTGAVVGVWQPANHIGAQVVNQANALVWNELQTRDGAAAKAFYGAVFGWEGNADANGYVTYAVNGRIQAGMIQMDENFPDNIPANWMPYIMVDDVQATADQAAALGGTVVMPPHAAGEMGTFTVIRDPQGAVFTAMKFNGPVDTPPG
jgi:predicted enzyme related to lactoylglutathione lyase